MFTWQGLEKTYIGIYFSYQLWLIKIEYLRWSTLKSNYYQSLIDFELNSFFHMVQCTVYYNFLVYKFGFYLYKNMLWLFEWKQSPRVLGLVCYCILSKTLLTLTIALLTSSFDTFRTANGKTYIPQAKFPLLD
jgi:hypothetical protein